VNRGYNVAHRVATCSVQCREASRCGQVLETRYKRMHRVPGRPQIEYSICDELVQIVVWTWDTERRVEWVDSV